MVRQWPPLYRLLGGVRGTGSFAVASVSSGGDVGTDIYLTAPVATWVSAASVAQAVFQLDVPTGVVATNKIRGRASLSPTVGVDGKFTSTLEEVAFTIGAPDLVDFQIDDFAFAPFADGLTYVQFWVTDVSDVQISTVSDTISETIATASPFDVSFLGSHSGGSTATPTKTAADLGVADADRKISVAFSFLSGAADLNVTSVTIGDIAATFVSGATVSVNQASAFFDARIYEAEVPDGPSGDIVVTLSGTSARFGMAWWRVISGTASAGAGTSQAASAAIALTPTIPASGVGLFAVYAQFAPFNAWTNLDTEDCDIIVDTSRGFTAGRRTTAGSTTVTANCAGATAQVMVCCAYEP